MEARSTSDVSAAGPAGSASPYSASPNGHGPSPGDALRDGLGRLAEVREYLTYFLAAKVDGIKVTTRNLLVYAVLGLLALAVGGAALATTGVLLIVGIADGLGELFGQRYWLGKIVVSVLILGTLAAGTIFGLKWLTNTSRKRLVSKYEDRQRKQRYEYGHDVAQRAADAARESVEPGHAGSRN